ncbi:uncharacterized protein C5orf52 homolog [Sorex araneus]|uniref:uncharacterized protein C5orf52 homolog n=1 Tax=Sorex araneus TaxID=42254 RepID=UPI0024335279|nr:uncharacterized protein C5orf52 homolog [Sorex araneus]
MAASVTAVAPRPPLAAEGSADQVRKPSVSSTSDAPSATKNEAPAGGNLCAGQSSFSVRLSGLSNRPEAKIGSQPRVFFLFPRTQKSLTFVSIMNASEAAVKKLLPKSNLSRVIIRDNLSAQRIYEIERKATEKNKKKMIHLYDHLKKKFLTDELRKLSRWRREFMHTQKYLDHLHNRRRFENKVRERVLYVR